MIRTQRDSRHRGRLGGRLGGRREVSEPEEERGCWGLYRDDWLWESNRAERAGKRRSTGRRDIKHITFTITFRAFGRCFCPRQHV